ncbi:hypothetical protein [Bacillus testis]|uniref:hypothetical protein n=1 Tax=Bacillus testis TaxID=1622072 RepID=UPI00067EABF5|nr:hypothetical protein [Bacillus testis]
MKQTKKLVVPVCLVIYTIIASCADMQLTAHYTKLAASTLTIPPYPFLHQLVFAPIGSILGMNTLIQQSQKEGKWRFNILLFLLLFLPSVYVAFQPYFFFRVPWLAFLHEAEWIKSPLWIAASIIVGYSIVSPWEKKVQK